MYSDVASTGSLEIYKICFNDLKSTHLAILRMSIDNLLKCATDTAKKLGKFYLSGRPRRSRACRFEAFIRALTLRSGKNHSCRTNQPRCTGTSTSRRTPDGSTSPASRARRSPSTRWATARSTPTSTPSNCHSSSTRPSRSATVPSRRPACRPTAT